MPFDTTGYCLDCAPAGQMRRLSRTAWTVLQIRHPDKFTTDFTMGVFLPFYGVRRSAPSAMAMIEAILGLPRRR
jgi:hypothetical protein